MHDRAQDNFKNSSYSQDQQQQDESSFVETAERMDKVSMVFGADEPRVLDQTANPQSVKSKGKKGVA